jgi:hypothetical protein
MKLFDADMKWRLKTASIRNPFGPGTVIALKTSHCIHIASRSHVTPGAMWVVMI